MAEYNPSKIIKDGNTYNFRDTTKIPLAGSNEISGSLIPSTDGTVNLGSPSYQWNNAYIKSLTVNGTAAGDILTHNASEFVPVSGGAVITGDIGRVNNTGSFDIYGGTSWGNGAAISLTGKDASQDAGIIIIKAQNDTSYNQIVIRPVGNITRNTNGTVKNFAMQEDVIPRSGGSVLSGSDYYKTTNDSYMIIGAGSNSGDGAAITFNGAARPTNSGQLILRPNNGSSVKDMRLQPDGTWTWDGTACQILSDQRLKQQIDAIDDKLLDAWEDVNLVQFKYNDAVETKGDNARLHTGYVVQQIQKACEEHGVDISNYGLFCHEEYPEETEEVEVTQKDGTKTKERKVIREANEHYSLRYTEALIVECKYLRRCIERLTARIEELEKGNNIK